MLSAVYHQLKLYVKQHFITSDQYRLEIKRLDSAIEEASAKYEKAADFSMKQYERFVLGEGSSESIAESRPARQQAEAELKAAVADKAAYEERYRVFCKLMKASRKEIPLSEIADCIEQSTVDAEKKITVRWH